MSRAEDRVNPRLGALTKAGGSIWLDQISRPLIESGELARLVAEDSLRGMTSNPSIFEKAILGSSDYEDDLKELVAEGLDARTIYDRIIVKDVQLAADVLADVHRETHGRDGFVSLEVLPDLAFDTERSIAVARSYRPARTLTASGVTRPGTPQVAPVDS